MKTEKQPIVKWYSGSFRRNMMDMHIEDWDESFLSRFDAREYVDLLKKARIQSTMLFANSHVGYCYWPTPVGKMHGGLKGRDLVGELTDLLNKAGIHAILYYSCIYDNWAYDKDPSWRVIDMEGMSSRERNVRSILTGRYGVCCPNSQGYRDYVAAQLGDLAGRYDIRGVYLDMVFWPNVCFCGSCTERYESEVGGKIPIVIDWNDETWIRFQKKREEKMERRDEKLMLVTFKDEIPRFVGINMHGYGPFRKGDIATLPEPNAELLVKKGIAEKVEAKD